MNTVLSNDDARPICSILNDHIDPRRTAFFVARLILNEFRGGGARMGTAISVEQSILYLAVQF